MRSAFAAFALCAVGVTLAVPSAADQLMVNGKARTYTIAQPATAKGPKPTIIVLHDTKGSGTAIAQSNKLDTLAPQQGFVAVFPDGQNQQWNFFLPGKELDFYVKAMKASGGVADDGAFLKALIVDLVQRGIADPLRIYIAGESNGSLLALRMICTDANLFAGAALLATGMPETLGADCHPPRPIPVLMIKGTKDEMMPYAGGLVEPSETVRIWSTDKLVGFFQQLDSDTRPPQSSVLPRKVPNFVQIDQWASCPGVPLTIYRVIDGAHIAPPDLDESQVVLDFFASPVLKSQCVASLQNPASAAGTPGANPGGGPDNNPGANNPGANNPNGQGTGPNGGPGNANADPNAPGNGPGNGTGPNVSDPNASSGPDGASPGNPTGGDTAGLGPPADTNPSGDTAGLGPPADSNPSGDTAGLGPPADSNPSGDTAGLGPPSDSNPSGNTAGLGPPSTTQSPPPTTTAMGTPSYTPLPPVIFNSPTPNSPPVTPQPPGNCSSPCCAAPGSNTNPTGPGANNGGTPSGKTNVGTAGGTMNGGTPSGVVNCGFTAPDGTHYTGICGCQKASNGMTTCSGPGGTTCTTNQAVCYPPTAGSSPAPNALVLRTPDPVSPPLMQTAPKLLPQLLPPSLPGATASTGTCTSPNQCNCPAKPSSTNAATRDPDSDERKRAEQEKERLREQQQEADRRQRINDANNAANAAAAASAVIGIVGAFGHYHGGGGGGGHPCH